MSMSTRAEAERHAAMIRDYWSARGHRVLVTVELEHMIGGVERQAVHTVRSDLVQALPRAVALGRARLMPRPRIITHAAAVFGAPLSRTPT